MKIEKTNELTRPALAEVRRPYDSRRRNYCNDEAVRACAFYLPRWMDGGAA